MIGMMTPSAMPMILLFEKLNKNKPREKFVSTAIFVAGYFIMWGLFSVIATFAQWGLESASLMMPMGEVAQTLIDAG